MLAAGVISTRVAVVSTSIVLLSSPSVPTTVVEIGGLAVGKEPDTPYINIQICAIALETRAMPRPCVGVVVERLNA